MTIEEQRLTVEDANRRIPLVRVIVRDAVTLKADVQSRHDRLAEIRARYSEEEEQDRPYSEEVQQMEQSLQADENRIGEYADELEQVGAQLMDAETGLVEFPSTVDGQLARLSWLYDEPEVAFWRAEEDLPLDRRPLQLTKQVN